MPKTVTQCNNFKKITIKKRFLPLFLLNKINMTSYMCLGRKILHSYTSFKFSTVCRRRQLDTTIVLKVTIIMRFSPFYTKRRHYDVNVFMTSKNSTFLYSFNPFYSLPKTVTRCGNFQTITIIRQFCPLF